MENINIEEVDLLKYIGGEMVLSSLESNYHYRGRIRRIELVRAERSGMRSVAISLLWQMKNCGPASRITNQWTVVNRVAREIKIDRERFLINEEEGALSFHSATIGDNFVLLPADHEYCLDLRNMEFNNNGDTCYTCAIIRQKEFEDAERYICCLDSEDLNSLGVSGMVAWVNLRLPQESLALIKELMYVEACELGLTNVVNLTPKELETEGGSA